MDAPEGITLSEGGGGGSMRHRKWRLDGGFSSASPHNNDNNSQHSKSKYARRSKPRQRRGAVVTVLISTFVLSAAAYRLITLGYGTRLMKPNLRKNAGSAAQLKLKVVPGENMLNESQQMNELQKGVENGDGNSVKAVKSTDVKPIQLNVEDKGRSNSVKITTNNINSFPPGCRWECYLDNSPDLSKALPRTEKAALAHYVEFGAKHGRDCKCKVMPKKDGSVNPPPAK